MKGRGKKFLGIVLGLGILAVILPACQQSNPPVGGTVGVIPIPTFTPTPCGAPATFGQTAIEPNTESDPGTMFGNPYAFAGGYVTSLSMYASGTGNFRMAIYTDNGSGTGPGNLIVQSSSQAVTGTGWNTVSIPGTYLAAATYWLIENQDGSVNFYYLNTGGYYMVVSTNPFGPFPSTIPLTDVCSCSTISLKAVYCP